MTTDTVAALSETDLGSVNAYWRAANYLSVGQIYLLDNPLLREPLRPEHIKPRLLGHRGTTPGLNLIYAHMNRLIRARDLEAISHKLADVARWPPIEAPERIANLVLTTAPVGGGRPA